MPALRVAFYARVSSDQQTEQGTIASLSTPERRCIGEPE
jgi:hypothetical protein